ncbi:MAG TPA: OmpA family protein [Chitinivibrionales bacterium]|nr:OmpA family protein [Chitinivibrionales bacterium]
MKAGQRLLTRWMLMVSSIAAMLASQSAFGAFDNPLPTTTLTATRGMSQVSSGEAMGAGRLSFSLFGSWYQVNDSFPLSPNKGANVYTDNVAFSFGVNPFIDVFASLYTYEMQNYDSTNSVGLGTVMAGIQGTLPFADTLPVRLGGQVLIYGGTAANQINGNRADGYNYFETRQGYDFAGKLLQSIILGNEKYAFKMHFNEGLVTSLQSGKGLMMTLAAGIQVNAHPVLVLGLEANSRTFTDHIAILTDPLWITPTITFRTPYYFNVLIGGDIALSKERDTSGTSGTTALKALESYRVFGSIAFSFDLLARQKAAAKEKEKQDALEKERLKAEADSMARLQKKEAEEKTKAMAAADKKTQAERHRADSLAHVADSLAQKARADSVALAESKRQVEEERSKRTDAEKQLLSTGLLLLDAVYFASGKTDININSKPYLNIIGKMLSKYPKLVLEVGGHTDNVGSPSSNMRLSQARAESVRMYLISVAPDLAGRLSAMGYGSSVPKAENSTADGRQMNRRVELKVLNKDVLKEYNP